MKKNVGLLKKNFETLSLSLSLAVVVLIGTNSAFAQSSATEFAKDFSQDVAQESVEVGDQFLNEAFSSISFYQQRYPLQTSSQKLVDNQGNGYEKLYGVRNMRAVLNGIVYRGGANNAYNKHGRRNNSNPLPNEGLSNLCEEGFIDAVYLYPTRYNTAPHAVNCKSNISGSSNSLRYGQESVLGGGTHPAAVLNLVYAHLQNPNSSGPIYLHCWNGWHASGFISALILRQFCGFSADAAVDYWNRNTDGNNGKSYEGIRRNIRAFQPDSRLRISSELQAKVCPNN